MYKRDEASQGAVKLLGSQLDAEKVRFQGLVGELEASDANLDKLGGEFESAKEDYQQTIEELT